MNTEPPPALLVDYGGVLTNSVVLTLERFCLSKGLAPDSFLILQAAAGQHQKHFHQYERGEITADEFLPSVASWLGITRAEVESMLDELEPDHLMFKAIGTLRAAGVVTCLLSNSWGTALYPRDLLGQAFDDVVISAEVGMRKPDPDIYLHTAERLGRPPSECVFLDDTAANVHAAEALGMTGVVVDGRRPAVVRLESIYNVDLAAFY
jgi:epoxide hydrolase-like predicted phosphatase